MVELARGALNKMAARLEAPVQYAFRLDDQEVAVNPLIGKSLIIYAERERVSKAIGAMVGVYVLATAGV
ncbi:MAG: hypothetical protein ACTS5I_15040, partial [Rhodanobacter sp.]